MARKLLGTRPPSSSLSGVVPSSAQRRAESHRLSQERAFHVSSRSQINLKQALCTTSSPKKVPTMLDAASSKKTKISRKQGFRISLGPQER